MNATLSEWLALREAADEAARSEPLVHRLADGWAPGEPVSVLDLCTGTGSNLRYLMDRLPARQHWLAIDRDAGLLAELPARVTSWAADRGCSVRTGTGVTHVSSDRISCDIETRRMDLDRLEPDIFEGRHLVTASALLDLVSESWLRALAARCRAGRASALFTITYTGGSSCTPSEPEDDLVRRLFNEHQTRDKGLGGPAAGPGAPAAAARAFTEAGYQVARAASDWAIEPDQRVFQRRLIEGWASAAIETAPERAVPISAWLGRRLEHVDAGRSRLVVNHHDMAAWLDRG
jgi:hypothetical protein